MNKIQRLSRDDLTDLREQLKAERGELEQSDLRKPNKLPTKPRIFDLTTPVAPSSKQRWK